MCDEDIGSGVPHALRDVGFETVSMSTQGWIGQPDEQWLAIAGQQGWLVLSANKRMLNVKEERDVIIREKVGIVYLTTGWESPVNVLKVLLRKWDDLTLLDETEPRPFVRFLNMRGQLNDKYQQYGLS